MSITNGYATLAEAKARLSVSDDADNTALEQIVEAVSRLIDAYCSRCFYVDSADATRYFTPEYSDRLEADDLVSVTSLTVDEDGDRTYERTWATTDYDLIPFNAALLGEPYTALELPPTGRYAFPVGRAKSVKIVGKWGYPAVPVTVREACLLQTARLFKRKDAIFGVAGPGELGQMIAITKLDPDVALLLRGQRQLRIGAV
jgi:hypothetical protein